MSEASQNLKEYQRQLDMDGVEVGVSRQALDETLAELTAANAKIAEMEAHNAMMRKVLVSCDKLAKVWIQKNAMGSPTFIMGVAIQDRTETALAATPADALEKQKKMDVYWKAKAEMLRGYASCAENPTTFVAVQAGTLLELADAIEAARAAGVEE